MRGLLDNFIQICYHFFAEKSPKGSERAVQPYFQNRKYRKIFYRCQRNDDCVIHFHRDIEIIQIISGCLEVTVRGETKRLFADDIMVASSNESHGFVTIGTSEFKVFIIPSEIVPEFIACTTDEMLSSPFLTKCSGTEKLIALTESLIPYAHKDITLSAVGYVYAILGILVEELGFVPKNKQEYSNYLLQKMLVYIEDHFREDLLISDVAKYCGYHKDYLSKIFNANVGCGFNRYVNLLRVRYAKKLIAQEKLSLDEICSESGFQSMISFRRAFTDYYGQSPYQYSCSLKIKDEKET